MQTTNIERYLTNDDIFQKISKSYISLDFNDVRKNNEHLKEVFDKLIEAIQQESPLFKKMYRRILWAGSYYKKTRVGEPEEYDINLVMMLPFKERDITFFSDRPGYIKIRTTWRNRDMSYNALNLESKGLRELDSFIDHESYLNQDKFRSWMEGILSKVAEKSSKSDTIIFSGYTPITKRKTGPAFTLKVSFYLSGKPVEIDVVPVLAFSSTCKPPPRCSKMSILQNCRPGSRYWSAVPKPLNNNRGNFGDRLDRYWRLCFYEFEKDILCNYGRVKPIIRFLKKLRDTQNWNIASYYIETLCMNELNIFRNSNKSCTSLFFTMLQKLREAFHEGRITYHWDEDLNLLEHIGFTEMRCMEGRINRIIKNIERTIADDKYAIARYILNECELNKLRSSIDRPYLYQSSDSERSSEPELENANQWNCIII